MSPITKEKWREILLPFDNDTDIDHDCLFKKLKEIFKNEFIDTYTNWETDNFREEHLFETKDVIAVCKKGLLSIAVENGLMEIVKCLARFVDVNQADDKGWTPLSYAVKHNREQIAKFLIENGADPIKPDSKNMSPLIGACLIGRLNLVKLLCQKMNLDEVISKDPTPVLLATVRGHLEVVKFFVDIKSFDDFNILLHKAAESGNIELVRYLVEDKNADVMHLDKKKNIPAVHAAKEGHYDVVKYFVEKNEKVLTVANENGGTIIHPASIGGNVKMLKFLIEEKNLDFMASISSHWTVALLTTQEILIAHQYLRYGRDDFTVQELFILHLAAAYGHLEAVKYIIEKVRIDENICDYEGIVPLHLAAANGQLEVVRYLVEIKNVSPTLASNAGLTALHLACEWGQIDVVKYLVLDHGVSLNIADKKHWYPLHFAANGGSLSVVKYLVYKNADLEVLNNKGRTPLHLAVREGHTDVVRYLVEDAQADINIRDDDYCTPVYLAASDLDMVKYFVEVVKVNFKEPDENGWTLLFATSVTKCCSLEVIKYLVEKGADVDPVANLPYRGRTLLHRICYRGTVDLEIMKYLIEEKHANFNSVDENGHSPMATLIERAHLEMVKYLVEVHNVDVDVVDKENRTTLHLASENGDLDLMTYLYENHEHIMKYINVSRIDNNWTPLYSAVKKGYYDVAEFLISKGAKLNVSDIHLNTPLHQACMRGDFHMMKLLVENGAGINLVNKAGYTPLDKAMQFEHLHLVQYLLQRGARQGLRNK